MLGGQDAGFLAQTRVVPSSRGGDAHGNSKQHVWKQTDREGGGGGGWAAGRAKKPTKLQLAHTDTAQPTTTTPYPCGGGGALRGPRKTRGSYRTFPGALCARHRLRRCGVPSMCSFHHGTSMLTSRGRYRRRQFTTNDASG